MKTSAAAIDHILIIGFGGPTKPDEIQPFLEEVTRGLPIPPARVQEVAHHYEAVGGRSPYNEYTRRFFTKLQERLRATGVGLPMFLGMRNWHPFLRDVMGEIKRQGLTRGLGVILAPHRCDSSYEKYIRNVENATVHAAALDIHYEYLPPWHEHPLFIEAQAAQVKRALKSAPPGAHLLFSAHSIPVEMAQRCRYVEEFRASSEAVAKALGWTKWSLAYQSRSGNPRQPWLEPDVASAIRELKQQDARHVIVVPIGFLCDHVEVLFDLDIEAKQAAQEAGIGFSRASTVMDHPKFVEMFAQLIATALALTSPQTRSASQR